VPASAPHGGRRHKPLTHTYGAGQVPLAAQVRCSQNPLVLQDIPGLQLVSLVHGRAQTVMSTGSAMHCVPAGQAMRTPHCVQTPPGLLAKQPPAVGGCSTLGQSSVVRHWTRPSWPPTPLPVVPALPVAPAAPPPPPAVPPSPVLPDEPHAKLTKIDTKTTTNPQRRLALIEKMLLRTGPLTVGMSRR
jgi:hypothetical protein